MFFLLHSSYTHRCVRRLGHQSPLLCRYLSLPAGVPTTDWAVCSHHCCWALQFLAFAHTPNLKASCLALVYVSEHRCSLGLQEWAV